MRTLALAGLTAALLLVGVGPALAQDDADDRGRRGGGGRPDAPVPIGRFAVDAEERRAEGEFVSFSYNATGLQGFSVGDVELFDLVLLNGTLTAPARQAGAQIRLESEGFRMVAHDNVGAVTRIHADRPVRLDFADGVRLAIDDGTKVTFAADGLAGKVLARNLTLRGHSVTLSGEALFQVVGPRGDFDREREHLEKAIEKRAIGVEASFGPADGDVVDDVVSYGNVTLKRIKAEKGELTVQVDGHGLDGRVIVLNVDGRVIGAASKDQLRMTYDNETIAEAANLTDVLDPDDDGLHAEWYVVWDPEVEAFQVIVSVPHYSVHTLSLTTVFPLPPPSVVLGVVAGVALLVPCAMLLFRRK